MADVLIKQKIRDVLKNGFFKDPVDLVDVSDGPGDSIHLLIASPKFKGRRMKDKDDLIWSELEQKLTAEEWGKVSLSDGMTVLELVGRCYRIRVYSVSNAFTFPVKFCPRGLQSPIDRNGAPKMVEEPPLVEIGPDNQRNWKLEPHDPTIEISMFNIVADELSKVLPIAHADALRSYQDLSPFQIEITPESDGLHVDYELKDPRNKGGGPHYVMDTATGAILSKRFEQ